MNNNNSKTEIIHLLDQLPNLYFPCVIEYLKDLIFLRKQDEEATDHLAKIIEEDGELLKRMAN